MMASQSFPKVIFLALGKESETSVGHASYFHKKITLKINNPCTLY